MRYYISTLLFLLLLSPIHIYGQKITFCYKDAWSSWIPPFSIDGNGNYDGIEYGPSSIRRYNDGSGLLIVNPISQITIFEFKIDYYTAPTKKEIRQHYKNNQWYEYRGSVSYYVNDKYPTAEDIAKRQGLVSPNPRRDTSPSVKRTARAFIRIAPYKKQPKCYNIWFDNVGVGVDISGLKF